MRTTPQPKRNSTVAARHRKVIAAGKPNCYICGKPIDYTLKTPHPESFEVDHVIALKRGGSDDLSNKSAAHRECNSKKRARNYAPIIRRSGALN